MSAPRDFKAFDHHSPNHRKGAEAVWAEMRAMPGLPHSDKHGGFHIVTRHTVRERR